jgi:5-methylcytosine-specific restriction endonuclease McrA
MGPLHSPKEYLFHLQATSSGEAKRMWRQHIKEQWNHQCAYCGSEENLTIDHIVPQCKGGMDFSKNVVCCCHSCNQSKGHEYWKLWYVQQDFYSEERFNKIEEWMKPDPPTNLFSYRPRRNNAT